MRPPVERARERIEQWTEARAARRLSRGDARRDAAAREERARRALGSGEVREAIGEAVSLGQLGPDEHAAMLGLVARAARDEVLARRGVTALEEAGAVVVDGAPRTLGALLDDALAHPDPRQRRAALEVLDERASRERARALEARDEGDALVAKILARGPRAPDSGPDDLDARAARLLDTTDDALSESIARAAHALGAPPPRTVPDACAVLRAPALDVTVPRSGRGRRLGAWMATLGLEAPLARVRLAAPHGDLDPRAHVVARDAPHRVDLAPSRLELGVTSELAMSAALGQALACALVAPALPRALRLVGPGSVARAIGALLAALHADPVFVRRARGLEGSAAEASRRVAIAASLAHARALAAGRLVERASSDAERRERGAALYARALGVAEPSATLLGASVELDPGARDEDLRAALLAASLTTALRDRYDEDWFRNPRAAEPLRAAAARGVTLAIEGWAEELGANETSGLSRVVELAR